MLTELTIYYTDAGFNYSHSTVQGIERVQVAMMDYEMQNLQKSTREEVHSILRKKLKNIGAHELLRLDE